MCVYVCAPALLCALSVLLHTQYLHRLLTVGNPVVLKCVRVCVCVSTCGDSLGEHSALAVCDGWMDTGGQRGSANTP